MEEVERNGLIKGLTLFFERERERPFISEEQLIALRAGFTDAGDIDSGS